MQNTWIKYSELASARRGLRGRTLGALNLIAEQLFKGEVLEFVASAEVNTSLTWDDGVEALSGQRLFVSGCNQQGLALAVFTDRGPPNVVQELQSSRTCARFQVSTLPQLQGIGLQPDTLNWLKNVLETDAASVDRTELPPNPQSSSSPHDDLLMQLMSLRNAGILTSDEFDAKKAEVLRRF
jgi:hypothetical protein